MTAGPHLIPGNTQASHSELAGSVMPLRMTKGVEKSYIFTDPSFIHRGIDCLATWFGFV